MILIFLSKIATLIVRSCVGRHVALNFS